MPAALSATYGLGPQNFGPEPRRWAMNVCHVRRFDAAIGAERGFGQWNHGMDLRRRSVERMAVTTGATRSAAPSP